jgi:far upstream element-binding protein
MTDNVTSKREREEEEGSPAVEEQPPPAKQQRTAEDDSQSAQPPTQSNQKPVEEHHSAEEGEQDAAKTEASQIEVVPIIDTTTETKDTTDIAIVVDRTGVSSDNTTTDVSPEKAAAMLESMNAGDEAAVTSDNVTIDVAEEQKEAPKASDDPAAKVDEAVEAPNKEDVREEATAGAESESNPTTSDPAPTATTTTASEPTAEPEAVIPAVADLPPPEAIAAGQPSTDTAPPAATEAPPRPDDPNKVLEEKGEISAEIAGRVIGKGGEVIRDLQARSGASIDVDPAPGASHRIVTYRGTRAKVDFAKHLVDMIARGAPDSDLPLGNATREVLLIPASATGKVIGRGGEMVREMQNRSQAKIDFNHAATASQPDKKQVVVTGTGDAVRKAKEMIMFLVANPMVEAMQALNLLVNEKLASGTPWGSGGPYPGLPNQGSNIQPEMLGSYGSSGGFGPEATYMAVPPPAAAPYGGRPPPDNRFGVAEEIFYAKKQFMGRIIGQKGVTINDLQKRSGADIQINQDVPPGQDCEIRLRGSRDGVDMVKQMLREIIEIGPGHPYAGGAPAGGGGGGGGGGFGAPYQQQGGYDYGQQPYAYPPQQQGYPPQQGGYGGPPPVQQYQGYGGYPPQQGGYGGGYGGGGGGPPQQYGGGGRGGGGGGYPPQSQHPYHAGGYQQGYQQSQSPSAAAPQQYAGGYGQPYQRGGGGGYSAPPSAVPSPAAAVWKAAASPDGQTYYYNEATGATQWDKPPGFP